MLYHTKMMLNNCMFYLKQLVAHITPLRLKAKINQFNRATSGVAAVEFALILPIMLLIYVGVVEITRLYAADRKAVVFAHTIADLATQAPTSTVDPNVQSISDNQLQLIFGLGASVLYPFDAEGASIRLTMYAFDSTVPANGLAKGFVDWQELCSVDAGGTSCTLDIAPLLDNPTKQARCTTKPDIDVGFATSGGYTMLAEVAYIYKPLFYDWFTQVADSPNKLSVMDKDGIKLKNKLYMQPRNKANVIRTNNDGTPKNPHTTPKDNYNISVACASGGTPGGDFKP